LLTVFPIHASVDSQFAAELSAFLKSGCDANCLVADAVLKPGEDLFQSAESAPTADAIILLLSNASNPLSWPRERWESFTPGSPSESEIPTAIFLLEECVFPKLLRRGSRFFDATANRLAAMRRLKRWLCGIRSGAPPGMQFSPDLDDLYTRVADKPGTLTVSGSIAERFAREAAPDFEAVLWIPSLGLSLAQVTGELGVQLQTTLDGTVEDNCRRIHRILSERRCLLVLHAPQVPVAAFVPAAGQTSVLFTAEPMRVPNPAPTLAAARNLFSARRFAEAYEIYLSLIHSGMEPESCARDLVWICEQWDRWEEARAWREHLDYRPREQLRLF
jgi:hypothetical protein